MELQTREIQWTIPALKARLDELDRQINVLRNERSQLGMKFDFMLRASARATASAPAPHDFQKAIFPEDLNITGFENSPPRG